MGRTPKLPLRSSSSDSQPKAFPPNTANAATNVSAVKILRLPEVLQMVRVGRTTLLGMVKSNRFPAPLHISERIRGWKLSDIESFLASLDTEVRND